MWSERPDSRALPCRIKRKVALKLIKAGMDSRAAL